MKNDFFRALRRFDDVLQVYAYIWTFMHTNHEHIYMIQNTVILEHCNIW